MATTTNTTSAPPTTTSTTQPPTAPADQTQRTAQASVVLRDAAGGASASGARDYGPAPKFYVKAAKRQLLDDAKKDDAKITPELEAEHRQRTPGLALQLWTESCTMLETEAHLFFS